MTSSNLLFEIEEKPNAPQPDRKCPGLPADRKRCGTWLYGAEVLCTKCVLRLGRNCRNGESNG